MGFEKKATYYLVVRHTGEKFATDHLVSENDRVIGKVEASSELAAYREGFGELPALDPGIRDLVVLLNEIPGIQTWTSCEGHKHKHDAYAFVGLMFENLAAVNLFGDLVSFVTSDSAHDESTPPPLGLCLELDMGSHFGDGIPISCDLILGRYPMDRAERGKPPGTAALRTFTLMLRGTVAERFPTLGAQAQPVQRAASTTEDLRALFPLRAKTEGTESENALCEDGGEAYRDFRRRMDEREGKDHG